MTAPGTAMNNTSAMPATIGYNGEPMVDDSATALSIQPNATTPSQARRRSRHATIHAAPCSAKTAHGYSS